MRFKFSGKFAPLSLLLNGDSFINVKSARFRERHTTASAEVSNTNDDIRTRGRFLGSAVATTFIAIAHFLSLPLQFAVAQFETVTPLGHRTLGQK